MGIYHALQRSPHRATEPQVSHQPDQSAVQTVVAATLALAALSACSTDPSVIQYGGIVCERVAASPDVPRKCWPADSLSDRLRREEMVR